MSDIIMLLRLEHDRMHTLLDIIERQLHHAKGGVEIDYNFLRSALNYCKSYLGQCHHPKEELIYHKLVHKDATAAERLLGLLGEHRALAEVAQRCAFLVQEIGESPATRPEKFEHALMWHFVGFLRQHTAMEEETLFPLALHTLSRDDWDEIEFVLFDQPAPLLDADAEERFEQRRRELLKLSNEQSRLGSEQEDVEHMP
jgi:hemerythrin-like domain-containing protein